jgi:Amt family ammonium transporter
VLAQPSVGSPKIPDLLFAVYQGMFAAITYAFLVPFTGLVRYKTN